MGIAYIPTTICVEEDGVFIFECECTAVVDYELDNNALYDFSIEDIRFEKTEGRWNGDVFKRVKTGEIRCPDELREILYRCADYAAIEEKLIEKLTAADELKPASAQLRGDHHSAVL